MWRSLGECICRCRRDPVENRGVVACSFFLVGDAETFGKSEAHEKENDNDESDRENRWQRELNELRISSEEVIAEWRARGNTFLSFTNILLHRSNLRTALQLSTSAQDNHLRALILSLIASQYVHTSVEHAETMLATAEQLAAGLGASVVKGGGGLRSGKVKWLVRVAEEERKWNWDQREMVLVMHTCDYG